MAVRVLHRHHSHYAHASRAGLVPVALETFVPGREIGKLPIMPSNMAEKILIRGGVIAILIFLIGPLVIVCGLSLNKANLIKFPPQELSLRWFADVWKLDGFVAAVVLSLKLAALTTVGTSVLGVMGSLALVRYRFV